MYSVRVPDKDPQAEHDTYLPDLEVEFRSLEIFWPLELSVDLPEEAQSQGHLRVRQLSEIRVRGTLLCTPSRKIKN